MEMNETAQCLSQQNFETCAKVQKDTNVLADYVQK